MPPIYNQLEAVIKAKERNAKHPINPEAFQDIDSVFSDNSSMGSEISHNTQGIDSDHLAFFKKSNLLRDNKLYENKIREDKNTNGESSWASQFNSLSFDNPSAPVSANNIQHQTGKNSRYAKLETERNLAMQGGFSDFNTQDMTYGIVDNKDFVHNNMTPMFSDGLGKGYGPNSEEQKRLSEGFQRKVDTFTGSVSNIEYKPRTERRPLFNPQVGNTWIYGMPNFTDYMATRYIPGRERRNERLMQPTRITPGLTL